MTNFADMKLPRIDLALRAEIEDLYARYVACVDSGKYDAWPGSSPTSACTR